MTLDRDDVFAGIRKRPTAELVTILQTAIPGEYTPEAVEEMAAELRRRGVSLPPEGEPEVLPGIAATKPDDPSETVGCSVAAYGSLLVFALFVLWLLGTRSPLSKDGQDIFVKILSAVPWLLGAAGLMFLIWLFGGPRTTMHYHLCPKCGARWRVTLRSSSQCPRCQR